MVTEIRRVNFFNEQFLQEGEFQDEQRYHQHLHRRLNYMLFDGSGVVEVQSSDLAIAPTNPPADKTFRVLAGVAMSRRTDLFEGREVILREDTDPIDLAAEGIGAGDTAFVTIHYEEADIQGLNLANNQLMTMRIEEQAVVRVHNGTPADTPPDGEQYIVLGTIDFDTMAVDDAARDRAELRATLIGAKPVLSGFAPNSGGMGANVTVSGENFKAPMTVNFTNATVGDPRVESPAIVVSSIEAQTVVPAGAGTGTLTVTTPSGESDASGAPFFVT